MRKAIAVNKRNYAIVRRYRTSMSVVDERLLSLDIDTKEPLAQEFFEDLELLVKKHLNA